MSRADYAHWNEEADRVWYAEEGRHEPCEPELDDAVLLEDDSMSSYAVEMTVRGASRITRSEFDTKEEAVARARRWRSSNSTGEYVAYVIEVAPDGTERDLMADEEWSGHR